MNTKRSEAQEFLDAIAEEIANQKTSAKQLVRAVQEGDADELLISADVAKMYGGLEIAFRQIAELPDVPKATQNAFLQFWLEFGDSLRSELNNDPVLLDALRVLLPAYLGDALTLYRGESMANRKHRAYGMSWTTSRDTALDYAKARAGAYVCGTVLLETQAPARAIICAPWEHDNRFREYEFVVDRRRLLKVCVVEKFPYH